MTKALKSRTYWCDKCHVPLLGNKCGACENKGRDISSATLVPVYQSEIKYLKKHVCKDLHSYQKEMEIWVNTLNYNYYYRGKLIFKLKGTLQDNFEAETYSLKSLSYSNRPKKDILLQIQRANRYYVQRLQYEAESFIVNTVNQFRKRPILISFSGGKDSTVISHLVMNALGCSDILHIFADTTIELPDTIKYIDIFQKEHPITPFIAVKSSLDFFKTAESIGPPSRIQRWCCSTHKTNPLAKLISGVSPHQGVLTFDGIRKAESSRRSSYPRISNHHKIAGEILARPIIDWTDIEIWIYLLYHGIRFNNAYKRGFRRVGCLYCPFNSNWSAFMIKNYFPRLYSRWHKFLHSRALHMKHPNPDNFVLSGWRVRAGGKGLDYYKSAIESARCTLSDSATSYQLLSGDVRNIKNFLRPLGPQTQITSNEYSEIFLIHEVRSKELIASVEIGFEDKAIRINYLLKKNVRLFRQRVEKQLRKLQSCIYCGSCVTKCTLKALYICETSVKVDNEKCISCLECVSFDCPVFKSLFYSGKSNGRI